MRTIDADSFADRMYREAFEKDSDDQKWDSGCWIRYKMFERVLREAPTIEPRKKGKWINHRCDDGHHVADCDQCGHSLQWFDDDIPKYCCECGAEMREPEDIPMEYFESGGR